VAVAIATGLCRSTNVIRSSSSLTEGLVSRHHKKSSVVLTSNRGFADCGPNIRRPGRRCCHHRRAAAQHHRAQHPRQLPDAGLLVGAGRAGTSRAPTEPGQGFLTTTGRQGILTVMFRKPRAGQQIADARRALTMAMKQLAESRGVELGDATNHIRLVRDLRDDADEWLIVMVRDAIEACHTWAAVGESLGVTKQAAHERFAPLILARAQGALDAADEAT
jgi:hypothetical protein